MLRPHYTLAERRSDAVVHVVGLTAVAVGVPMLIVLTALRRGDPAALLGTSIYGLCLIAMLLFSALYNIIQRPDWSGVLKRLDHCGIYLKIAGTYTPFTLLTGQGTLVTVLVWIGASVGLLVKALAPHRFRWLGLSLYLLLGWAGALAGWDLFAALNPGALALIVTGGLLYSVGVVAYLASHLRFHYTVWHVFVLAASVMLYAAVLVQVMSGTAQA